MSRKTSKEIIKKIRREVLSGKSKYQVTKEMGVSSKVVYYHTRDIPSKNPGRTEIRGKTLELLKELLQKGHVNCRNRCSPNFHTLQKHFPVIKRAQAAHKTVYYLEDKNKDALRALLENKRSKIINYQDLASISKIFHVQLRKNEKQVLLGKNKSKKSRKNQGSSDDSLIKDDVPWHFFTFGTTATPVPPKVDLEMTISYKNLIVMHFYRRKSVIKIDKK